MNSNTTEELVKQKIELLDTLQAGIVFGREDAWNKLQTRLDAKPIRKPLPIYSIAAVAAILLVLITIGIRYFQQVPTTHIPDAATGFSNNDVSIRKDVTISSPVPSEKAGAPSDSFRSPNTISSAPVRSHHIQPAPHYHESPILPDPQPIAQVPQPGTNVTPPPVVATKPVMKVVHINELGKEQTPVYETADEGIPHPHVTFKMKVVHINDLMKPVTEDDYLHEIQNNTAVHIPLFHRQIYDNKTNEQPKNFFRINL